MLCSKERERENNDKSAKLLQITRETCHQEFSVFFPHLTYRSSCREGSNVAEDNVLNLTVRLEQTNERLGYHIHLVTRGNMVI